MVAVPDGSVRALLRLEGAAAAVAGLTGYVILADGWLLLFICALAPDLSMLAYLRSPRLGSRIYNLVHSYVGPAVLAGIGLWDAPGLLPIVCVWLAHIGADRALGFGLKSADSFERTHLGPVRGWAAFPEACSRNAVDRSQ
jgi:hypothetical protein